jgi:protein disulfide-isomerase
MNMRKPVLGCAWIAVFVCAGVWAHASEVLKQGHKAGQWTQDYDAALAAAKKNGIPLLLNFTGSDWCGWCKKMDAGVFSKPEWKEYARKHVALAYIDFPRDKSKVPQAFVARNKDLSEKYGIGGYPTYVLLDSASGDELGRLNAKQDTPAKFIAQVNAFNRFSGANLKKLSARNPAFKKAADGYVAARTEIASLKEKLEAAEKKQKELREKLEDLFVQARAKELGDRGADYLAAHKELKEAQAALQAWLATSPQRNQETMKKFEAFKKRIDEANAKLSRFDGM